MATDHSGTPRSRRIQKPCRGVAAGNGGADTGPNRDIRRFSSWQARSPIVPRLEERGAALAVDGQDGIRQWISRVTALAFAAVTSAASGVPAASTARWCLEPFFLPSAGLGPVFSPCTARTEEESPHHAA